MDLEELLREHKELIVATEAIKQAFNAQIGEYEATEKKLIEALESIHKQKATKLRDVAAVLDDILKK